MRERERERERERSMNEEITQYTSKYNINGSKFYRYKSVTYNDLRDVEGILDGELLCKRKSKRREANINDESEQQKRK